MRPTEYNDHSATELTATDLETVSQITAAKPYPLSHLLSTLLRRLSKVFPFQQQEKMRNNIGIKMRRARGEQINNCILIECQATQYFVRNLQKGIPILENDRTFYRL